METFMSEVADNVRVVSVVVKCFNRPNTGGAYYESVMINCAASFVARRMHFVTSIRVDK